MKIETDDFVVEWEETQELKEKVYQAVLEFFKEFETFCGESICQMDDTLIEAPHHLALIADKLFKFNVQWKE